MRHDQSFKNLFPDYPREAIHFGAAAEAAAIDQGARILPIRQVHFKERLGERFRELDTPLLVEWPDGRTPKGYLLDGGIRRTACAEQKGISLPNVYR